MSAGPLFHAWPTPSLKRAGFTAPWIRVALEGNVLVLSGAGVETVAIPLTRLLAMKASVVTGRRTWHTVWLTLADPAERIELTTPPALHERDGYERVVLGLAASLFARGLPVTTGHGWLGAVFGLGGLSLVAAAFVAFSIVLAIEEGHSWWHPLPGFAFIIGMMALLWRLLMRETPRRALTPAELSRAFLWR